MIVQASGFDAAALERFRALQRRSFAILEETAAGLVGGESEKEVGRALVARYRAAGADSFFHLPVVLFGERTALPGAWKLGDFFPRSRRLEPGDAVVLDAAPIFGGFLVDTSYSFCFGSDDAHREMMRHLAQYREGVRAAVEAGETFRRIATRVGEQMAAAGYEAVHTKHPGRVLGHRAVKTPKLPFPLRLQGFDAVSLTWFRAMDRLATLGLGRRSPLWNTLDASDHAPHDGLWLVEPHAGCGPVGAKWEEILVIENGRARWLDDAPPHLEQWSRIEQGESYGPRAAPS